MMHTWTDLYDNGVLAIGDDVQTHIDTAIDLMHLADLPEGHVRVARVLVYEGEHAWVAQTLGRSPPDGCRTAARGRLHVRTIRREGNKES